MSRGLSTTNLPPTVHKSETSDTAAQLKGERLSEDTASEQTRSENASEETSDSNILWVNWDGPGDPMNPKSWSYRQKWTITIVVSSFTFIGTVSSSMIAPAAAQVAKDLDITSNVLLFMTISIFVLGYSIGPLFLAPLSEIYGRSHLLQLSNFFYLGWNFCCGFSQTANQLIAFRFLSGIGGGATLAIGGGVLSDIWLAEERGRAVALYSLAPLLGPVVGSLCGAWISERSTWRWVFWSTSIVGALVQLSGLIFLQESFAPCLLEKKAQKIRETVDVEKGSYKSVRTVFDTDDRSWKSIFTLALIRPFQLFAQEPIVQVLAIYSAFLFGILYVFLTIMPSIFADIYNETPGIAGLHYIPLGVGLTIACQLNARLLDRIYIHYKNKNGGVGEPEFRLPTMVPASIIIPVGLMLSGWAAQRHLHWIATDIGIAFIGLGIVVSYLATQAYIIDAFTLHAASVLAVMTCLRSLAGFTFPLFAPAMFNKLGYGKGNTILACIAIILGCPTPILLWKYGRQIRMSSKNARKSLQH